MAITATTLSAALSASATEMAVASTSGFTADKVVLVDGELMRCLGLIGSLVKVMRGQHATRPVAHLSGAAAYVGPGKDFKSMPEGHGQHDVSTIPIGSVAYASLGTSGVHVAGTIYFAQIYVPVTRIVTAIAVLNGATVGTDNLIAALYPANGGSPLCNSALAGTLSAGANAFQSLSMVSPIVIEGGKRYWVGVQCNGTTATTRKIATSTFVTLAGSQAGTFGTLAPLIPPVSFTADKGPIAYLA